MTPPEPRPAFDRISLRRLVRIRWVAVAGQALALLVVHNILDFPLPLLPAFGVVACSAALNLFFAFHHRAATRLGEEQAAFFLGYDLLQLGLLLYLTGGLENPFAILILALVIFAVLIITVLALWHVPLPWKGPPPEFPAELVLGIWTALVVATVFISSYTWSV